MSKIRNMSRRGTIVLVASIDRGLSPSADRSVGRLGHRQGVPMRDQGDVDGTGALRVSNEPGIGQTGQVNVPGSWTTVIANDPTNYQIVTSINVDTWAVTPGINDAIQFGISQNGCASVSKTVEAVNPDSIGETEIGLCTGGLDLPLSWSLWSRTTTRRIFTLRSSRSTTIIDPNHCPRERGHRSGAEAHRRA